MSVHLTNESRLYREINNLSNKTNNFTIVNGGSDFPGVTASACAFITSVFRAFELMSK
jgi:hypothetical protein